MKPDAIIHVYLQDSDSCSPMENGDTQELRVETCDSGGGNYVVISTKRWALDAESLDEFVADLRAMLATVEPDTVHGRHEIGPQRADRIGGAGQVATRAENALKGRG